MSATATDLFAGAKVGALFAGYGGLEMGVGMVIQNTRTAWVAEFDKGPSKILAHRYPDAPNLGDVTKVDWSAVEPVDIITGGSPCQDLSHAGKRAGMKPGTRSGLWAAMTDAIEIIRPRLVIWENVRGALSAAATTGDVEFCDFCMGDGRGDPMRALGRVLGDLADLGYHASWRGIRAADVGAPHSRFRVFVLAWQADDTAPIDVLPDTPRIITPDPTGLLPTPRTSDTNGAGAHGDGGLDLRTAVTLLPTPTTTQRGTDANLDTREGARANLHNSVAEMPVDFGLYAAAVERWEFVTGRRAPSPTGPGRDGSTRLSMSFVEWMMGLPAGWVTDVPGITRNEALKALGNGVVPQQAAAAIRHLLDMRTDAIRGVPERALS